MSVLATAHSLVRAVAQWRRRTASGWDPAQWEGQRVWVVGASSGIGAALAAQLAQRGAHVAISARGMDDLREVASASPGPLPMQVVPCDVTQPEGVEQATRQVRQRLGGIDTVVYCVGFWKQVDAAQWDASLFEQHWAVNVAGFSAVLEQVVPSLVEQRHGHVMVMSSVAGIRGLAGGEAYGTTKAALIHLAEALRISLRTHGVRVTTVCPGFVDTPMTSTNQFPMPFMIEPEQAASAIVDGVQLGDPVIIFPPPVAVLARLARLVPASLWARLPQGR